MSRRVELLIYRRLTADRGAMAGIADAIESAWSMTNYRPFSGSEPVFLSFRWETEKDDIPLTRVWEGLERQLRERGFLTPDGARFFPGEMRTLTPENASYPRAWITLERKGKS